MANKKLVLDAGHGINTPGKRTLSGSQGVIHEWTMNSNVCNKIQAILKDYNVDIIRTDDTTGKTDVSLNDRVKKTNAQKPDLFISIHHNANASVWGNHGGTEVYWHSKGTAEDKKVATLLAPKLASKTGLRNRGVKQASFTVLGCNPTAILVEGGFMDSTTDYDVITSDEGQQAYAEAVAEVVIEYLGLKKVNAPQPVSQPTQTSKAQSVKKVNGEWKVKVLVDTNLWADTNFKSVNGQVKKGEILYITEMTEDGNFFIVDGKYLSNSHKLNYVTNTWAKPLGKIQLKQDCNAWSYANYEVSVGQIKAWSIYEYIDYKNGMYHIPYLGWVSESFVNKKLKLEDALVTN